MEHIVEIIKGKIEEITLPEKVDIIISEPIGFLLVHERMLETYVKARDKFLKEDGIMFPTLGTIFFSPVTCDALHQEQMSKACFWENKDLYGMDVSILKEKAMSEHFGQAIVGLFSRNCFLSSDQAKHEVDFR
eukprot:CAMPEP_0171469070 /NCGR_PEP_ID=MMETSP0945-20130129/11028_1 /TAXON_ID=109269 /ORGANISM="Vaucheria litorea, Strain CCMP2940" /LENGTH=132 /DNA_ID=CAMNT_0011998069 /DNA_START=198 /DNA_END=593 /DNA_ORIENTATION=+